MRRSVIAVALVLAGCATPEQIAEKNQATCSGYGFRAGTTEFAQCMQRETLAAQQLQQQRQQAAARNLQNLSQQYQPQPITQTNCRQVGQNVNCTTF